MREGFDVEGLYRRFGPMVHRRCLRLLGDAQAAQDAAHDVFVLALRHRARLDGGAPASLLLRMSTRVCLNRLRNGARRPESPDEALLVEIAQASEPGAQSLARIFLAQIFLHELESTRTMAVMHYLDGLTLEQVAREVGMSVSGVRKRLRTLREAVVALPEVPR